MHTVNKKIVYAKGKKMKRIKYQEHPLYPRIRMLGLPLHELKTLVGSDCICESGLSRALRGITPLKDSLRVKIEAVLTKLETEKEKWI